ncbi:hypothetical protein L289_0499 [Acinetobacter gerneri DSM 14967 = CIP 107464 = MTCC 9824]|nr:hypothetical protein L289_0499 [Acinetobacter gerneri DSM 14967 = CIP 107464 = MTCC 9824]
MWICIIQVLCRCRWCCWCLCIYCDRNRWTWITFVTRCIRQGIGQVMLAFSQRSRWRQSTCRWIIGRRHFCTINIQFRRFTRSWCRNDHTWCAVIGRGSCTECALLWICIVQVLCRCCWCCWCLRIYCNRNRWTWITFVTRLIRQGISQVILTFSQRSCWRQGTCCWIIGRRDFCTINI